MAGGDCKTECGDEDRALSCTSDAKCNGNTTGALAVTCNDSSECKASAVRRGLPHDLHGSAGGTVTCGGAGSPATVCAPGVFACGPC